MTNHLTAIGGLGKDPELKFTQGGRAVCNFGVATEHRFKAKDSNEWESRTTWVNCVLWGDAAENFAASCSKGDRVIAVGRLEQRSWETPEGDKRTVSELIVDEVGPSARWAVATVQKVNKTQTAVAEAQPEEPPF